MMDTPQHAGRLAGPVSPRLLAGQSPGHFEPGAFSMATAILSIISRYGMRRPGNNGKPVQEDGGAQLKFLAQIYRCVREGGPVRMCLPAFPFKSPNRESKVLGHLPDKAEEFALAHLNGMCAAIGDVYKPGAKLTIISDGLVYNDLLGVADRDVWAYGTALRALAAEKGFDHIEFNRLRDLMPASSKVVGEGAELDEITYVASATEFRRALLNVFGRADYDASEKIAESEDTCLTYRGYIKFLDTDLATVYPVGPDRTRSKYKKSVEFIAKRMLSRGDAFARAVRETFPDHVRLSIHPTSGGGGGGGGGSAKISVSPLPTDTLYTTPWHCAVGFRTDGTLTSGPRSEFERDADTWELVTLADGRPSHFRERFAAQGQDVYAVCGTTAAVTVEPMYPAGLLVKPAAGPWTAAMADMDGAKVRALAERNSPVVLRGFRDATNRDAYVAKAHEMGVPTPWKFGLVLEVKDRGDDTRGLNNVLSAEWMPWHYDGLFKTVEQTHDDGTVRRVSTPPRFMFFTAVTASPRKTGYTLFAGSPMVFKHLPERLGETDAAALLRQHTWRVGTGAFEETKLGRLPLVVDHPTTGKPCLRYHEPWPQSKTAFTPTVVEVEDLDPERGEALCDAITATLHDRRVALWHTWEKGDLCINDNTLAMHTRSDFTAGCNRELWRIHFD